MFKMTGQEPNLWPCDDITNERERSYG